MTDVKQRLVAGRTIDLGDDVLMPRKEFGAEIGLTDRATANLNLQTVYIGRVAHVPRNASLKEIASRLRRRHEPRPRRAAAHSASVG